MRLDVSARGFCQTAQMAFFGVRVFSPSTRRYAKQELSKTYQLDITERKRLYNEQIMQVDHSNLHHLGSLQPEE